ncbi:sigma-70 family RNA polymerase sigma factor [Candidatus Peregrinibacteria bacterium]|jgi:RNA polymerase sigma factor (sigma-70 family)|nr:sigma-70 family RNA polymerase sigma factor [Candidatus Peregrinibacteria bacterium]MBT7736827.1 sigma-70 family RNA polymerase sigma factor [Candidatus Peregrinibacteria bacterium]
MAASNLTDKKEEIEALVALIKKGDHDAFAALYDIFIDQIFRYVYYRVRQEDAEDIVETAFLKVWENIGKYNKQKNKSFSAWIFRITHNLVVDYYRASKDREFDELKIDIPTYEREHSPIKNTTRSLDNEILRSAISKLKKNYRDVIIYKFVNELDNAEIADIMSKSEGSLRILQFRALKSLKQIMRDMGMNHADFDVTKKEK